MRCKLSEGGLRQVNGDMAVAMAQPRKSSAQKIINIVHELNHKTFF